MISLALKCYVMNGIYAFSIWNMHYNCIDTMNVEYKILC